MSHPGRSARDVPYQIAADAHWLTAGSTRQAGPSALPDRRATRTEASEPLNLTVYDLAGSHDDMLRAFAERFGTAEVPSSRTALATYAAGLAAADPAAAADYELHQLVDTLRGALTIGDADDMISDMTCPKCLCWCLLGVRDPSGRWRIACHNLRCAYDPDPARDSEEDADGPTPGKPRTWSLYQVARHHLATAA